MKHIVYVLSSMMWMAGVAQASASYEAGINGLMVIREISTQSIFDKIEPSDETVPGFTITVDPQFLDPTFRVVREPTIIDGSGDYAATAGADARLLTDNPFDITEGDQVSVFASAAGQARDTNNSTARSSAGVRATLYFVNHADVDVFVDALWSTSGREITSFSGPDGEDASAGVDIRPTPFGDLSGGTDPRTFQVAPGTTYELTFSAAASGSARAPQVIPEPASLAVWTALGVVAYVFTRKTRIQSGGAGGA